MTRIEQKENRKKEIINKSLDLFITKGYTATTIGDIAKANNMSMGLLFHYFESKEKLYETLIDIGISGQQFVMNYEVSNVIPFFEIISKTIINLHPKDSCSVKIFV